MPSPKLQIKQTRVVFSHLKWVKLVRHNSKCVKIQVILFSGLRVNILVTMNTFSTIFAVQNKFVGLSIFVT